MNSPIRHLAFLFVALSATTAATPPIPAAAPTLPEFAPITVLPSTRAAAADSDGLRIAAGDVASRSGDTETVLVQVSEARRVRQWIVEFSLIDPSRGQQPARSREMRLYTNSGHELLFAAAPLTPVHIEVRGPYSNRASAADAKKVVSAAMVNPQFLGLGFDRAIAMVTRLGSPEIANDPFLKEHPVTFRFSDQPMPPETVARDRPGFDYLHITEADERAFTGMVPAFMEFFQLPSQTAGLREILFEAVDVPWWAIVTSGGHINVGFEMTPPFVALNAAEWGLPPAMSVYAMGLRIRLQNKPALNCRLAVTTPRVPLLNTAGIIGIAAVRPNGKGPRVMIGVLSGHPAGS